MTRSAAPLPPPPRRARRFAMALVLASAMPIFILGCPKKDPPAPEDAAPPPAEPDVATVTLGPPEEDASDASDADAAEGGPKNWGPAVNPIVAKMKACCSRIAAQGAQLGNTPEAFQVKQLANLCYNLASSNAPEANAIRALAAQAKVPGCM